MTERLYLAVETATEAASVALGRPGGWDAQVSIVGARRHAAQVQPAVAYLLAEAGVRIGELGGIVVGDGPGSFTGLRIGAAAAKGLVHEHGLPLVAVPSLLGAALSAHAFIDGPVAALYDALRGEVFAAVYDCGTDRVETVLAPRLLAARDLPGSTTVRPRVCVGDGASLHGDVVRRWSGRDPVGPPWGGPAAGWLLVALRYDELRRPVADPGSWEPAYGRLAEAQVRWEQAHGRPLPGSAG